MKSAVIIGCGSSGMESARRISALSDRAELTGFCDLIVGRAESLAEKYGGEAYIDAEAMLDEVKPDFAVVCLPPYCTDEILPELIGGKIPFLCGMPVSIVDGGESAAHLAQVSCVPAFVLDGRPFSRCYRAARQFADKYAVIKAEMSYITPVPDRFWRRDDELSGGIMAEKGLEALSVLCGLFGGVEFSKNITRRGYVSDGAEAGYGYQTDDMLFSMLCFKNGTAASMTLGNFGTEPEFSLTLYAAGVRLEWVGGEVRLYGEDFDPGKSKRLLREGRIIPDEYGGGVSVYRDDGKSSAESALVDLLEGRKTPDASFLKPLYYGVELYKIGEKITKG